MPYVNGVRVSLAEYNALKKKDMPVVAVNDDETDAFFTKPKRTRKTRMNIIDAVEEVTGTTLDPVAEVAE